MPDTKLEPGWFERQINSEGMVAELERLRGEVKRCEACKSLYDARAQECPCEKIARQGERLRKLQDFLDYSGATLRYPLNRLPRLIADERAKCRNEDDREFWRYVEERLMELVNGNRT